MYYIFISLEITVFKIKSFISREISWSTKRILLRCTTLGENVLADEDVT